MSDVSSDYQISSPGADEKAESSACPKIPRRQIFGSWAIVFSIMIGFTPVGASADDKIWTRSAILNVADEEARRLEYDIEHMSVSFDSYNSKWNDYLASAQNFVPLPEVQEKLKDRDYWAVYFASLEKHMRGGDLWVFIDRQTGEVITVVRGE